MAKHVSSDPRVRPSGLAEQLLLRSGQGDTGAFADLYDLFSPRVYGLVQCLVRDAVATEAVAREVFLEVWRRAGWFDPHESTALAWILALAHRLAVRTCRLSARTEDPSLAPCHDTTDLETSGLSDLQVAAIHLAYFDCLDHRTISTRVDSDRPATALITDGLRRLELSAASR